MFCIRSSFRHSTKNMKTIEKAQSPATLAHKESETRLWKGVRVTPGGSLRQRLLPTVPVLNQLACGLCRLSVVLARMSEHTKPSDQ